jgi:hypothetical protein
MNAPNPEAKIRQIVADVMTSLLAPDGPRDAQGRSFLQLLREKILRCKLGSDWFDQWLPYCLQRLNQPGHVYLPLNRYYKPLGGARDDFFDYEQHAGLALTFRAAPHTIEGAGWLPPAVADRRLYLHGGDPKSRRRYFERLAIVLAAAEPIGALGPGVWGSVHLQALR